MKKICLMLLPMVAFCSEKTVLQNTVSQKTFSDKTIDFSVDFLLTQSYVSEEYVKAYEKLQKANLEQKDEAKIAYVEGYHDALYDMLKYMRKMDK